ncbi:hypothetical protein P154DRAFT_572647 [Amniculicola lignicola CBS 123094]|uniref:Uncharacterized protein n=1 Tax=Amniculicola lignicola CBS 123094 TaxID=1392246 RepID=A0A6A5X186_9PLEO|nr:hypothetical protein P154DRAFT_572647 [Amniculicola lignicola CBS 123094]
MRSTAQHGGTAGWRLRVGGRGEAEWEEGGGGGEEEEAPKQRTRWVFLCHDASGRALAIRQQTFISPVKRQAAPKCSTQCASAGPMVEHPNPALDYLSTKPQASSPLGLFSTLGSLTTADTCQPLFHGHESIVITPLPGPVSSVSSMEHLPAP